MSEWHKQVQLMVDEIDRCIKDRNDEALTLSRLAEKLNYSEYHLSRKFREVSGMTLREYLRQRRLAFALKALRDTERSILDIALDHGFSSHEAFSRAFRTAYGVTPAAYRKKPVPVALRTVIRPFDCYLCENGGFSMHDTGKEVKTYFVTIPAHKFLCVMNYESIGYWDFWKKMAELGQPCDKVCGILDSIPGKLDDMGGSEENASSGQLMAFLNAAEGRICSWGIPLAECYGVRLPAGYDGPVPEGMILTDVAEGEYVVFEHGPFDYQTENADVERKIEAAMAAFDYGSSGYALDLTPGRLFYFYHDETRYWKYVRPVRRIHR
ncbi:MAG: helix-turn-helix transcriptional regulator [Oscillospiraceae bacterium]|nr:helix-turn-helix transcriptional regulator [Oscillospiraceae bacterium]